MTDVRIYKPSRTATQSGSRLKTKRSWILEYEIQSKREPEPLMGWVSSEDTLNQVRIRFETKEDAVAFAVKKGWSYSVTPEQSKKYPSHNYSDGFRYIGPQD